MPTRIVVRDPSPPPEVPTRGRDLSDHFDENEDRPESIARSRAVGSRDLGGSGARNVDRAQSTVVRKLFPQAAQRKGSMGHISRSDISASPRLVGYILMLLCSIVITVTTVEFYTEYKKDEDFEVCVPATICYEESDFFRTINNLVLKWKLYAAIGIGSAGTGTNAVICLAHVDGILCPNLWRNTFRDGSKAEMIILVFLILLWIGGLYICTSIFSVGEVLPNVYFSTWFAFAAVMMNFSAWRAGADRRTIRELFNASPCETSYNWWIMLTFSAILALYLLDSYFERGRASVDDINYFKYAPDSTWVRSLSISWSCTGTCIFSLLFCYFDTGSHYLVDMRCCKVRVGWRLFECIAILALIGLSGYGVFEFTGVNGLLNYPSNTYFACWGLFFSSLACFGTWLHENKEMKHVMLSTSNKPDQHASVTLQTNE